MGLAVLDQLQWRVMRSTAYTFFTNLVHRGALKMNPEYDSIDGKPITPAEALSLEHQLLVHGYSYCDSSLQGELLLMLGVGVRVGGCGL